RSPASGQSASASTCRLVEGMGAVTSQATSDWIRLLPGARGASSPSRSKKLPSRRTERHGPIESRAKEYPQPELAAPSEARFSHALIIDGSSLPGRVCDPRTVAEGGTNADDLTDVLRNLERAIRKENTS